MQFINKHPILRFSNALIFLASQLSATVSVAQDRSNTPRVKSALEPLTYELGFLGSIQNSTNSNKYDDTSRDSEAKSKTFTFIGYMYRIIGDFEIGPLLSYSRWDSSSTYKDTERSSTSIGYSGGLNAKYNFADIQTSQLVPYIQTGLERSL